MEKTKDPTQTMLDNLPEKTGKSLTQWHSVLKKSGFSPSSKHGELMKLLKGEFDISHGFANLIALSFRDANILKPNSKTDDEDLVDAQYRGKETLKPLYDKLLKAVLKFGKDVEVAPKKAYVSLRRSKQFAIIQPSTKSRLDVGIQLKDEAANERLEKSGSFNAMVSHRVRLTQLGEVDAELIAWLQQAYKRA